jgi:hypothetical protein
MRILSFSVVVAFCMVVGEKWPPSDGTALAAFKPFAKSRHVVC